MSHKHLTALVDEFGTLSAQMADLDKRLEAIKSHLIETKQKTLEGVLFRVTIARFSRDYLNMDAVRAKLSPQFIAANTHSVPVVVVKAVARNNRNLMKVAA